MSTLDHYKFIDIHYHATPDLYNRRLNAIEAGEIYQSCHGAVVLKSHLGATSVQATLAQRLGLPVFPSLVLNAIAGGIDYRVILRALSEYQPLIPTKMIVHFPTITGRTFKSKLSRQLSHPNLNEQIQIGETLFNSDLNLRKEAIDILKISRDYPIIISTGHALKEEIYQLIDACIQYKVDALLLNQPAHPLTNIKAPELKKLTQNDFVWVEQTALTYLIGHQTQEDFNNVLMNVPRVIYSSDLGQVNQMDVGEWVSFSNDTFDGLDMPKERRDDLMLKNAIKLISL